MIPADFASPTLLEAIILGIIQVVVLIVNLLLLPFSLLVSTLAPEFDTYLLSFADTLVYAQTYMGWILNSFAIPPALIYMLVGYYSFVIVLKLAVLAPKVAGKWIRFIR